MPLNKWYIRQAVYPINANLATDEAKKTEVVAKDCSPMESETSIHNKNKLPNARITPDILCNIDITEVICGLYT